MIGLDTNVLARFLVQDDPEQCARARSAVERALRTDERLFVPKVVLCELVWVLGRGYRFPRPEIIAILEDLLRTEPLVFEDREQVRAAVESFRRHGADFADYLILESSRGGGCSNLYSFDAELRKAVEVIPP